MIPQKICVFLGTFGTYENMKTYISVGKCSTFQSTRLVHVFFGFQFVKCGTVHRSLRMNIRQLVAGKQGKQQGNQRGKHVGKPLVN